MENINEIEYVIKKFKRGILLIIILWTSVLGSSLAWNIYNEYVQFYDLAVNEALTHYNKDMAFRYWATSHGGYMFRQLLKHRQIST